MRLLVKIAIVLIIVLLVLGFLKMIGMEIDIKLEESFRGWIHSQPGNNTHRWIKYKTDDWRYNFGWWPKPWLTGLPLTNNVICPTGCMNIGKGFWGCPIPGNNFGDCRFASDCQYCNSGWF